MTVEIVTGDMFESGAEALVCAANARGRLGAGQALECKRRFAAAAQQFAKACRKGNVPPGAAVCTYTLPEAALSHLLTARIGGQPLILFATTKDHPSRPSTSWWIAECAGGLAMLVDELGIRSIAVPALGCGLGGLSWVDVKPILVAAAERVPECRWLIYEPHQPASGRQVRRAK